MSIKRVLSFIFVWLLTFSVTGFCWYQFTFSHFLNALNSELEPHLSLSLDQALFSDKGGRVNDKRSIAYVGKQINKVLSESLDVQWFSIISPVSVSIDRIDGISIHPAAIKQRQLLIFVPRNHLSRKIELSYDVETNFSLLFILALLIAVVVAGIQFFLPAPISEVHHKWLDYLIARHYDKQSAYHLVSECSEQQLALNDLQWRVFNLLHRVDERNFSDAISVAADSRLLELADLQVLWFLHGLQQGDNEQHDSVVDAAWKMALADDKVCIDLREGRLSIHNKNIPIAKTPFFYYAWYAEKRLIGDGWMINPQSNKPDQQQGQELAELMWKYNGHAKAIADLEQVGLKAKTLDQNRSKIKESLVEILGESLAAHYLFATEKDAKTARMQYRLMMNAEQIELIQ